MVQATFFALLWATTVALAFYLGARLATKQIARGLVNGYKQFVEREAKYARSETPIGDRLADDWDIKF
jgi:hypothetical protein